MKAPKFTPAPWSVEVSSNTSHTVRVVVNSDGEFGDDICVLGDVQTPEIAANASLIAAAPELYEALAEILEVETRRRTEQPTSAGGYSGALTARMRLAFESARAALAKAVA